MLDSDGMGNQALWYEILDTIEPSIEELSIRITGRRRASVDPDWTFPKLVFLEALSLEFSVFKYFARCTTLVTLKWPKNGYAYKREPDLFELLNKNANLTEISGSMDEFVKHSFGFKLQKLMIRLAKQTRKTARLYKFLKCHAETLESLNIDAILGKACLELVISDMPRLSSLAVGFFRISNWQHAFPVNTTITSLELMHNISDQVSRPLQMSFDTLIRGLSSLKHLKYPRISDMDLLFLSQEVPDLESLETKNFNVSRLPAGNIFPKMKRFTAACFNEDMEVPISDTNFAVLVCNEMMRYFQREYVIE